MRKQSPVTFWLRFLLAAFVLLTGPLAHAEEDFLDPEVAFKLSARPADDRTVEVTFTIAPGYYLYREQFKFAATNGATLGSPTIPPGKTKFDETFQKTVETYRDVVHISVPVQQASGKFQLLATNQGCADKGLCYPPQQRGIEVQLKAFGGDGSARVMAAAEPLATPSAAAALGASTGASPGAASGNSSPAPANPSSGAETTPSPAVTASDSTSLDGALRSGKFWPIVGVFLVAGLLLSFTPCVLPMLPILSSIIVGHGAKASRGRGFALALSYSLGMAVVYTALGVAAGLAGEGLAASLQKPWVLSLFAAGLVGLSLSMFGLYELQLPSSLTGRLSEASQRLPAGRFASVFVMGGLSALIVSPCVAAPLAGALVYLSQTRDVWLGGTALFSLAAGMSVPLLLIGASAGALLPRAGGWMDEVKRFFGMLLLGVALWTVQSVLPAPLTLALWGAIAIATAMLFASGSGGVAWTASTWRRAAAAVFAAIGLLQLVGAAAGGADPLQPLAPLRASAGAGAGAGAAGGVATAGPVFKTVRNTAELDAAIRTAGRPTMLDFYADWCVSCKEMERFTFSDPAVQKRMSGALLLKADVTANSDDDKALLKRFQLFGPPGTIFFDSQGSEVASARLIGFQDTDRFLQTLQSAGL